MLKSMTGFGRGECEENGLKATVEIRSVNHRFCETLVKIGRQYFLLEEKIKERVQKYIVRGHLDIYVNIEDCREKKRNIKLDKELVVAYYNCLREIAEMLKIDFQVDIYQLAQFPDVISVEENEEDFETVWLVVQKALDSALNHLVEMRLREGSRLYEDLCERKSKIARMLAEIKERAPELSTEFRNRLKNRLNVLLDDVEVDEARLMSEVVIFAERSSIEEEVVRLSSHLDQLTEILNSSDHVGRKLDFLIQEMNREINTIGSKAGDIVISSLVIEIKSELEKMREQAQNLE